jgi:predicted CoA-binding protein
MGRAPDDAALAELLRSVRTVAVVGLSPRPDRPSHQVARYLQAHGYRVLPVNPAVEEVLGERAWASVDELPEAPDVVCVFRRPAEVPPVAEAAVRRGARVLWLQLGITHPEAEAEAARAGLVVVSDRCMRIEHARLLGDA